MHDKHSISRRTALKITGATVTGASLAGCTGADDEEEYPSSGSEIQFIIPYSSGGGFDAYSRALAEYLPNHLSNDVEIVAENHPGGGGTTGANMIYNADPDGYTMGIWNNPGFLVNQIMRDVDYDMQEVSWIGLFVSAPYLLVANPDSDIQEPEDLIEADEVSMSQTGPGSTGFVLSIICAAEMDINLDHVMGYEGSSEKVVAAVRGDVDTMMTGVDSLRTPVEEGDVRPIIAFAPEPPDYAPDVPTAADAGFETLSEIVALQRIVGGPPDIPEDRLETLRDAFMDTVESDEMQEWSEEAERDLTPRRGDEVDEIIQNSVDTFTEYEDVLEEEIETE